MIYSKDPKNWQQLESWVANVFTDIGCDTSVGIPAKDSDGIIDVDVWVVDNRDKPAVSYHVECKHWGDNQVGGKAVSRLIDDLGNTSANRGMIVSTSGFDQEAYDAAGGHPIDLLSFDELQTRYWPR